MARIGVVGLGLMGGPMTANFITAGNSVSVVDKREDAAAHYVQMGASRCELRDFAESVDVVFTIIPRGLGHEELYFGEGGLLNILKPGALLVDCATASPQFAKRVAIAASQKGLRAIDAPVSGGVSGAIKGTLTFMAGGIESDVDLLRPLLKGVAAKMVYLGPAGAGQSAKICNNMLVGAITAATCEAFALAEAMKVDPIRLFEVMTTSTARSWVLENLCPIPGIVPDAPSTHEYRPGGQSQLLLKDLTLAIDEATALGVATPVGAVVFSLYQMFCNQGHGVMDSSGLIKLIQGERDFGPIE